MVDRKKTHIELAASQQKPKSDFDLYSFEHCALPNFNFNDICLETRFLDFDLSAPLLISSMTGGTDEARLINRNLAIAARHCGIAVAVGSQRISIERQSDVGFGRDVKNFAGNAPIFGNVGLANLIKWRDDTVLARCAEQVDADAMFIHLNSMQEVFQDNGDIDWSQSGCVLEDSIKACPVPVIVKEVGMGLDIESAKLCQASGAAAIDVAGKGGTDFISIEGAMAENQRFALAAHVFSTWGQSTPMLLERLSAEKLALPVVASGGIRNGLDVAKCLSLGASIAGIAGRILPAARNSDTACIEVIEQLKLELKIACWGTGNMSVTQLNHKHLSRRMT